MTNDYESFKREIFNLTSIDLSQYKERQMKRRIDALIVKHKIDTYVDYISSLKSDKSIYDEFINYLTINVSEFFRNKDQWELLESTILPEILKHNHRTLNIWSAACSTGDEPYSLAMLLSKHISLDNVRITATDIDKQVLAKAISGRYHSKELIGIPSNYLTDFFMKADNYVYEVKPFLKKCITFKQHNLLLDTFPKNMDLIICRNVLIYFTEEAKTNVYKNFRESLVDEGFLFVGNTEQIIQCSKIGFYPYKSFFYKKV